MGIIREKDYQLKTDGVKEVHGDGAVRNKKNKGRFDLIEEQVIVELNKFFMERYASFKEINMRTIIDAAYQRDFLSAIYQLIIYKCDKMTTWKTWENCTPAVAHEQFSKFLSMMLNELAIHHQKGAEVYGVRNCEKGLPFWTFVDSGLRHLNEYMMGLNDENHYIACIWNFYMAQWTIINKPETIDDEPTKKKYETDISINKNIAYVNRLFGINPNNTNMKKRDVGII